MTPRTRRSERIRVYRGALSGTPRITVVREMRGRKSERNVGPRGWLSLEEAAALLARPPAVVARSIQNGFLRARREGRNVFVTLAACDQFLREEREDLAHARASQNQRRYPAHEVHAELGL